jgi:hypothetical protein
MANTGELMAGYKRLFRNQAADASFREHVNIRAANSYRLYLNQTLTRAGRRSCFLSDSYIPYPMQPGNTHRNFPLVCKLNNIVKSKEKNVKKTAGAVTVHQKLVERHSERLHGVIQTVLNHLLGVTAFS